MTEKDIIKKVNDKVADFVTRKMDVHSSINSHLVEIGTSILCAKWGIGHEPGGFVKAILANDLVASFSRADHINKKHVGFYVDMLVNCGYDPIIQGDIETMKVFKEAKLTDLL